MFGNAQATKQKLCKSPVSSGCGGVTRVEADHFDIERIECANRVFFGAGSQFEHALETAGCVYQEEARGIANRKRTGRAGIWLPQPAR